MRSRCLAVLVLLLLCIPTAFSVALERAAADSPHGWGERLKQIIERHLGYPYGFGHSGPRRFDCSGFVWRVMTESGIKVNRTSARKLFLLLPKTSEQERWQLGTVVFFNRQRHCGLIEDPSFFYHASSKRGTTRSSLDPYWRSKISGFRMMPQRPVEKAAAM